jgi:Immunoglobulin I-set domain
MAMGTESVVMNAGERLALQCVVKGGLPLTLTWLKEGAAVSNVAGLSVKLINDFTVSLTVETLSWQHSGHYNCWAQNEGGRAEASVAVIVQGKDGVRMNLALLYLTTAQVSVQTDRYT